MRVTFYLILLLLLLGSCSGPEESIYLTPEVRKEHESLYQNAQENLEQSPLEFKKKNLEEIHQVVRTKHIDFNKQVKPIIDNRCVVCHSCYDSPCQLKLTAKEAITRGASKEKVYEGDRLLAIPPSRLYVDAKNTKQWRSKDFYPVISDEGHEGLKGLNSSSLAKMLLLKSRIPLPQTPVLPSSLDFSLENDRFCPKPEEMQDYAESSPFGGMPYALPALTKAENYTILKWVAQGSKIEDENKISKSDQIYIEKWEDFLNQKSNKAKLMSRYLYEHLYLASLYFKKSDTPVFYQLVRSKTPIGKPVDIIATRRPFDDPKIEKFYYRLIKRKETVVAKNHMPYLFDQKRMNWYQNLFLKPKYIVKKLPSYRPDIASNPFESFRDIPTKSKYEFLLKESMYTISGFIKGPVCRGQIALNVIQDHFWVYFLDPKIYDNNDNTLIQELAHMSLPAEYSNRKGGIQWFKYEIEEKKYLKKKFEVINKTKDLLSIDSIWNGNRKNQNAALTIFRHFDSASVVKGLVGQVPKTAWVFDYPLLERVHYLLVAGFDVYADVSHQLNTRLYMDFLRMEGESNFLAFLPSQSRIKERDLWYKNASESVKDHIVGRYAWIKKEPKIKYQTKNHKYELHEKLKNHLGTALNHQYDVSNKILSALMTEVDPKIVDMELFSQVSYLLIDNEVYSLIHNNAHENITHLLTEGSNRAKNEDSFTIVKGAVGTYPNTIFKMNITEVPEFVGLIEKVTSPREYARLLDRFGVRRSNQDFWKILDRIHKINKAADPIEFGLLDLNRLENR